MIHNWECIRCTHQWCTSCFGYMFEGPKTSEQKKRDSKQGYSRLCWDCFEKLEKGEIVGLELYELYFYLREKSDCYGGRHDISFQTLAKYSGMSRYSGMSHEYISGYDENMHYDPSRSNFVSGTTAEEEQLHEIVQDMWEVFKSVIESQRTPARIELDEWREKTKPGMVWFGPAPRPEGFVGDGPGKERVEVLFGLDMASGDIIAPTLQVNDGTGVCTLPTKDIGQANESEA